MRPPLAALALALLAAALHMLPWAHAWAAAPPGWELTGNVTFSPDAMQYRTWMRQALEQGPVVDDAFTTEPHRAFLPVAYYWAVAHVARLFGVAPEWVNAWIGVPLAALLVLLIYWSARWFLGQRALTWWVVGAVVLGGGLTAHLRILNLVPAVHSVPVLDPLVSAAHGNPTFEASRFHYVVRTLFDSHFLLIWAWALTGILSLYFALLRPAWWRSLLTALLFAGLTLVHVYEGPTLLAVGAAVTLLCWRKGIALRPALATLALSVVAVAACLGWLYSLYHGSGLPFPPWEAPPFPVSNILMAFPLGWGLLALGLPSLWRNAGLDQCFLLGWVLGCTALLISFPYYPYHDRGAVTLQIPLHILAGAVWARRYGAVSWRAGLVALAVLGAAPLYVTYFWWKATRFNPAAPWLFQAAEDRETVALLRERGRRDDVLLAPMVHYRWLAPDFPGRSFDAHFFLTVDFDRKRADSDRFWAEPDPDFLRERGVRFVWVPATEDPTRFAVLPGMQLLLEAGRGSLFEREDSGGGEPR